MPPLFKKLALPVACAIALASASYFMESDKQAPVAAPQAQAEAPVIEPVQAPATVVSEAIAGIITSSVADIEIFRTDTPSIQVVGENQELIDSIKTEMSGNTLLIGHVLSKPLNIKCGNSSISLGINGNSSTINYGPQTTSRCALVKVGVARIPAMEIRGSGSIRFTGADQQQLTIISKGSGSVTGEGKVDDLQLQLSGSGGIDTTGVEAKRLSVLLMGSGNIEGSVKSELQSSLLGSGNITIFGKPKINNHEERGSGKFRLLGN